jgi:hypothetical protein
MAKFTREQIEEALNCNGYKYFTSDKGYDVNIVGIRNSDTHGEVTNKFDDTLTISYKDSDGKWIYNEYKATTDPGSHWEKNLLNKDGVAILKPGQYRGSHKLGLHQGKYEALRQKSPVKVYRDNNKDGKYDLLEENVHEGIYGINIHRATSRAGGKSTQVDKWSAGCQVIADNDDWHEFLDICQIAREKWGNSFTYTLIDSSDIS